MKCQRRKRKLKTWFKKTQDMVQVFKYTLRSNSIPSSSSLFIVRIWHDVLLLVCWVHIRLEVEILSCHVQVSLVLATSSSKQVKCFDIKIIPRCYSQPDASCSPLEEPIRCMCHMPLSGAVHSYPSSFLLKM